MVRKCRRFKKGIAKQQRLGSKGWAPKADIFGGVVKGVAQIAGTSLFHGKVGLKLRADGALVAIYAALFPFG